MTVRIEISKGRRRSKQWVKIVAGVNRSQKNGYAIEGEFINPGQEYDVEEGSIIYEFLGGSGRILIAEQGAEEEVNLRVLDAGWLDHPQKMPTILDEIEKALAGRQKTDPRLEAIKKIRLIMSEYDISASEIEEIEQ